MSKRMLKAHKDEIERIRSLGGEGILTEADLPRLSAAAERVLRLMLDRRWHYAETIIKVARQREGLRRMRELRARGYTIVRERQGNDFCYRLIDLDAKPQTPLLPWGT